MNLDAAYLHVLGDLTNATSVIIEAEETNDAPEAKSTTELEATVRDQAALIESLQAQMLKAAATPTASAAAPPFTTPPTSLPPEWRASSMAVHRQVKSPALVPAAEQLSQAMGESSQGGSEQLNLLLNGTSDTPRSSGRKSEKTRETSTELMARAMVARENERRAADKDKHSSTVGRMVNTIVPVATEQLSTLAITARDWLMARLSPGQRMMLVLRRLMSCRKHRLRGELASQMPVSG